MISWVPCQKIQEFRSCYQLREMDTFLSWETSHIQNKMMISYFQVVTEASNTKMLSYEVVNHVFLWIDGSSVCLLGLWGSISDFAFFCRASTDTGKWRSFIIRIQLNSSSSTEVGYDNGCPAPLVFPFHAFPPLKPPCLLLLSGGSALQILLTVESWSLNSRATSL